MALKRKNVPRESKKKSRLKCIHLELMLSFQCLCLWYDVFLQRYKASYAARSVARCRSNIGTSWSVSFFYPSLDFRAALHVSLRFNSCTRDEIKGSYSNVRSSARATMPLLIQRIEPCTIGSFLSI